MEEETILQELEQALKAADVDLCRLFPDPREYNPSASKPYGDTHHHDGSEADRWRKIKKEFKQKYSKEIIDNIVEQILHRCNR